MSRFVDELWATGEPYWRRVVAHDFMRGLCDGGLDPATFRHYLVQDVLFLEEHARTLALIAARCPDGGVFAMLADHAQGVFGLVRGLFAEALGGAPWRGAAGLSPTNLLYVSWCRRWAYEGTALEALGAVLPVYWQYGRLGHELRSRGSSEPTYAAWIARYGGEGFDAGVLAPVLAAVDSLAAEAGAEARRRARANFAAGSRFELMFWDAVLAREGWPYDDGGPGAVAAAGS